MDQVKHVLHKYILTIKFKYVKLQELFKIKGKPGKVK